MLVIKNIQLKLLLGHLIIQNSPEQLSIIQKKILNFQVHLHTLTRLTSKVKINDDSRSFMKHIL